MPVPAEVERKNEKDKSKKQEAMLRYLMKKTVCRKRIKASTVIEVLTASVILLGIMLIGFMSFNHLGESLFKKENHRKAIQRLKNNYMKSIEEQTSFPVVDEYGSYSLEIYKIKNNKPLIEDYLLLAMKKNDTLWMEKKSHLIEWNENMIKNNDIN